MTKKDISNCKTNIILINTPYSPYSTLMKGLSKKNASLIPTIMRLVSVQQNLGY